MIDIKEIKKTCPKSYELLKKWVNEKMNIFLNKLYEESNVKHVEKNTVNIHDDAIDSWLLMSSYRQLFDFFDDNNIHLSIGWTDPWSWAITPEESFQGTNRQDCENQGFKAAFEQLERTL